MDVITTFQYLCLVFLHFVLPCTPQSALSNLTINKFNFIDSNLQFVIGQPITVTFYLELQVSTDKPITYTYNIQLYFNGSVAEGPRLPFTKEIHFPSPFSGMSRQFVFRDTKSDEVTITLPSTNCNSFQQYCVDVTPVETIGTVSMCLGQEMFEIICDEPTTGPFVLPPFFWPAIVAGIVTVIFIVAVCIVIKRYRKRIAASRFWQVSTKSPNEAYDIIKERLNRTWNNTLNRPNRGGMKPMPESHIRSHSPTPNEHQIPVVMMNDDEHIQIDQEDSQSGIDNPEYHHNNGHNTETYPEIRSYEDNLQSISGGSSASHRIQVIVESGRNSPMFSRSSRQNSSGSTGQGTSDGSYLQTRKPPSERMRAQSIFPVKPEVNLGGGITSPRLSRSSGQESSASTGQDTSGGSYLETRKPPLEDPRKQSILSVKPHVDLDRLSPASSLNVESSKPDETSGFKVNLGGGRTSPWLSHISGQESSASTEQDTSGGSYLETRKPPQIDPRKQSILSVKPHVDLDRLSPASSLNVESSKPDATSGLKGFPPQLPPPPRSDMSGSSSFSGENENDSRVVESSIQVNTGSGRNSPTDSHISRQESSVSTEQDTSAGSSKVGRQDSTDRPRFPPLVPAKPKVEIGRNFAGNSEPSTPDTTFDSLGFPPLPPPPPHQSQSSAENDDPEVDESSQYPSTISTEGPPELPHRGTSLVDLRTPDDMPMKQEESLPGESSTEQELSSGQEQVRSGKKEPPLILKPKPPKEKPLKVPPKPKPKPSTLPKSTLPKPLISRNLSARAQQNQKGLPDALQQSLNANYPSPVIAKPSRLGVGTGTGSIKRSQADFAAAVFENFMSIVEEIEKTQEVDEEKGPRNILSSDVDVPERPTYGAITSTPPMPVEENTDSMQVKAKRKMSLLKEITEESNTSSVYVNKWNKSREFKRTHLRVHRDNCLGQGQFGKVYEGVASNIAGRLGDTTVAIKELKNGATIEDKDEFLKELAIHTLIEPHDNVIEMLGCCIRDEPLCIILEFMHNGSLLSFLKKEEKSESYAQNLMVDFGHQIALGMEHVANMGIVHRDLAARNILVSERLVCKVSDFGFARDVFGVKSYNKLPEQTPVRWYSPETIQDDVFTAKTDVWSFGILLFEIITMGSKLPYHEDQSNNLVRLKIQTGGVPPKPLYCNDELYSVMKMCWRRQPEERPEFGELAAILSDLESKY